MNIDKKTRIHLISQTNIKRGNKSSKSHFFSNTIATLNLSYFEDSELRQILKQPQMIPT